MAETKPTTEHVTAVFCYWNKKDIVKHRKMTDAHARKIKTTLKDYSVIEICKAIFNYANILHSTEYYWTYRWTLKDFLQRGIERFMDEAYPYENFKSSQPVSPDNQKKEGKPMSDRLELWRNASPEERKELEEKWRAQL